MLLPLRQYKAEDAKYLVPFAIEQIGQDWQEWAKLNEMTGPAFTCEIDGIILGAGGIRLLKGEDGNLVGWPWYIMTEKAVRLKLSVFRTVSTILRITIDNFSLKKLVTESKKGFIQSQRLLDHLGFKRTSEKTEQFYFYSMEI